MDTFSEWFGEYEIFIMNGCGKNVIRNSNFGKQLLRLKRISKICKKINYINILEFIFIFSQRDNCEFV